MTTNTMAHKNNSGDFEGLLEASLKHWGKPSEKTQTEMWRRACDKAVYEEKAPRRASVSRLVLVPALTFLVVLAFFGGYVGVVLAEGSSLPGEPLYKIERRAEGLWLSLTPRAQRCEVQMILLERRMSELKAMLAIDKPLTPGLTQEIQLMLQAIGEEAPCSMKVVNPTLRQVTGYVEELNELQRNYPGVWELQELSTTAAETQARLNQAVSPAIP
jgi:hypothetical protein